MKFDKTLIVILSASLITVFGVSYTFFAINKKHFIDSHIRNRNHNIAKLELQAEKKINDYVHSEEIIHLEFNNSKENVFTRVYTSSSATIKIYGYNNKNLKEEGVMNKVDDEYRYSFNFDYFDINSVSIVFNEDTYVSSVCAYYLK